MKSKFILTDVHGNSKNITKKEALTLITKEQFDEAKYAFLRNDPVSNTFRVMGGVLQIWFEA